MSDWYILEGHTPVYEPDLMKAARWFETADRIVAKTTIGTARVSTVFLGLDHGENGEKHLFETMIFNGDRDDYQTRCATWEQAEKMHADAVEYVMRERQP
ncbi:hypothetical protein [Aestuariivirga sp.]|uniref:hypothetical protein n=1 Tax=Aestuariivirga sp. TaxID=2650926 RepID=UPI0039E30046